MSTRWLVVVGFVAVMTLITGKGYLLSVAIVWALVSFVATLALSKHLSGKAPDE